MFLLFCRSVFHRDHLTMGRRSWSLCYQSTSVSIFVVSRFSTLPLGTTGGLRSLAVAYPGDHVNRRTTKLTNWPIRPAKTQISQGIRSLSLRVRLKKHWFIIYPLSPQRRLWSNWADANAVLILRWAHMTFCRFCHIAAHFIVFYHQDQIYISGDREHVFVSLDWLPPWP